MIWMLFSELILKPMEEKITVEEGKDYFFRLLGDSENNYGDSYLGESFYIVSDFIKDQERYLHLVYLGNFSEKIMKDKEEFILQNITPHTIKIETIKSFFYFKFFYFSKWMKIAIFLLFIIVLGLLIYGLSEFIRNKRKRSKERLLFFNKYSRLDFEDIVMNKNIYEKLLKKDLTDFANFIKKKLFVKKWNQEFLDECKRILGTFKK